MFRVLGRRSLLETIDTYMKHGSDNSKLETNIQIAHKVNTTMEVWIPVMSQPI